MSELHLVKFPDSLGISMLEGQLQNWSMLKISSSSHHYALDQRSWDSKIHRSSCDIAIDYRAKRFHRLRYAWWDNCVCIEQTSRFRKRVSVEGQCAQKSTTDSHEGHIANMIHEHLRATGAYEAVQGLSDLFNIRLQNDNVQSFDVRWDQALLSASEWNAFKCDPERILHFKITRFCWASDCFSFLRSRHHSK